MKKKKIVCVIALLFTATAFAACGAKTHPTIAETEITGTAYEESSAVEGQQPEAEPGTSAQAEDERLENSRANSDSLDSQPETSLPQTAPSGTDQPKTDPAKNNPEENNPVERPSSATGALHVEGTQLMGKDGEAVQLRGISTHGLAWFPEYVNEACFQELKETWKINVIRLAMYTAEYGGYCSGGDQEMLKEKIREGVEYALAAGLYVIIDWHILSDSNPQTHQEEAKAFFDEMASLYAASDHVLYEICNEPNGSTSWSEIKSYAREIISVIRAHDEDAVILVGTPNWSQYVDQAAADPITEYDNLMYTLHFYAATHKEDLRKKMTDALEAGLPVFVSEYGICDASGNGAIDEEQADQWIACMNEYGVSYVAWNLSNKNEASAILSESCKKTSGFLQEDLSASGRWLYEMLTGSQPLEESQPPITQEESQTSSSQMEPPSKPAETGELPETAAPQPPRTEAAEETPGQPGGMLTGDDLELTPVLVNSWESDGQTFYHYSMTLRNVSGKAGSSWSVELEFSGEITLSDGWNGDYFVQGKTLRIASKDYNGAVAVDGVVSDVGFIVSGGSL